MSIFCWTHGSLCLSSWHPPGGETKARKPGCHQPTCVKPAHLPKKSRFSFKAVTQELSLQLFPSSPCPGSQHRAHPSAARNPHAGQAGSCGCWRRGRPIPGESTSENGWHTGKQIRPHHTQAVSRLRFFHFFFSFPVGNLTQLWISAATLQVGKTIEGFQSGWLLGDRN